MLRLILACCAAGLAAADYTIDPAQSTVAFSGTSTLHDFAGTAKLLTGTVHLDAAAASGVVEADTTSMTTADRKRDERMHNYVMKVPLHPRIRFDLTGWIPSATGGTAAGTWTMVGVAKPVTFPVTIEGGRAKAHLDLNIRDWKIRTPRLIFITVGDIVRVDLDLALIVMP